MADHDENEARRVGLCLSCRHARTVRGKGDAVYYLCRLSRRDPSFPRYPRLPVLDCSGYEPTCPDTPSSDEPPK